LEKELGGKIKSAPDEWDRLYNFDFFIPVGEKFIGIQIKPINQDIPLSQISKEKEPQLKSHERFTKKLGGKVFFTSFPRKSEIRRGSRIKKLLMK